MVYIFGQIGICQSIASLSWPSEELTAPRIVDIEQTVRETDRSFERRIEIFGQLLGQEIAWSDGAAHPPLARTAQELRQTLSRSAHKFRKTSRLLRAINIGIVFVL